MRYKFLSHTADVKFQSYGNTLEEAFENAAMALRETIAKGVKVKAKEKHSFVIEHGGGDKERMLYDFLEEFLHLLDAEDFLMNRVGVKFFDENRLEAEVWGDKASGYEFTNDVKAITYNQMQVREKAGEWVCQVVVDV